LKNTLNMLGLCRRAGKLSAGFEAVKTAVKNGRARLVIIARDISDKSKKEIIFIASSADKPVEIYNMDADIVDITQAIGIKAGIISIDDEGFANKINL